MTTAAPSFGGSVPANYQRYLVPMFFQDYAADLAGRVDIATDGAVLETAAGTGAVTRRLRNRLPPSVALTATDINQAMLAVARASLAEAQGIVFQSADATDLPFADAAFDAVVCQFGVMFFPDKEQGFAEAARVLKPGGAFHFSVWDALDRNVLVHTMHECVTALCPDDPPQFLTLPFAYNDLKEIADDLQAAGFGDVEIAVLPRLSRAETARDVVLGQATGSPLLAELEARGLAGDEVLASLEQALTARVGPGPIAAPMQAIVFTARLP